MNAPFTTADLIGQYLKLRTAVETKTKEFEASLTPYKDAMVAIEGAVTQQINDLGGQSIKTEQGTAYRTTTLGVKVADRELFMDFVFDGRLESFLTNHVAKEAVTEYIEKHQAPPPGVDVVHVHKTNFRKAT